MKHVPFALPDITDREIIAVTDCLRSGWLTSGKKCQEFEEKFAASIGSRHAIAVSSATMAALLILDCMGAKPGDHLLVAPYTFSGPAMMAHRLGMFVDLVDVSLFNFNMDPADLERALNRTDGARLRVVMPTHFAGASCAMPPILAAAGSRRDVYVVDDAAHAFPSMDITTGFKVGAQGAKATFFSFYATKTLTTGEGGMITTDDDALAEDLRRKRLHGFNRPVYDRYTNLNTGWRYDIADTGWKANLTDLAAAMGIVQLERQEELLARRKMIALRYNQAFAEKAVTTPTSRSGQSRHLYPIIVDDRDAFIAGMADAGIQCSMHFIPLHQHSYWKKVLTHAECPNADWLAKHEVSLPIYSTMSSDDIDHVISTACRLLPNKEEDL